ncbi:type IV pilin protein [Candidatus Avelusimicrobium caledoniensis]|uniref:type IV pilin protein n=1 Tax=Candidatus Avelusimicrobium caledoniensis TaxID=3416220 RepID=UPI003D0E04E1
MKNKQAFNKHHVMLNLIQHLQRRLLSLRNSERGRSRIKYGMTPNFMGFTLIELLVVVLIIGILAAVAVPQYQKAVEKSRAAQAYVVLKSVVQAQEAYKMANGSYATKFEDLAVEIPWTGTETWAPSSIVTDTRSNGDWSLQLWRGPDAADSAIYLGRIRGKYKGGGFAWTFQSSFTTGGTILCFERTGSGVIFEQPAGSYCHEIFKGTLEEGGSGVRSYILP